MDHLLADDSRLLAAWHERRDEAAFQALCARHAGLVGAVCRRHGSPDVEEAAQAVFLVLARRAGAAPASALAGWLTTTARQVVDNQRRAVASRRRHEKEAAMEQARLRVVAAGEPWDEASRHLDEALASLSANRREAVLRFYLQGKSQAQIATELGCSADAVKIRVHEGLQRLRQFFARRGVVLGAAALVSGLASEAAASEPALASACAKAVLSPASAPGAAAIAATATTAAVGKLAIAAIAVVAVLAMAAGGIAIWRLPSTAPVAPPSVASAPTVAAPPAAPPADVPKVLLAEDFDAAGFGQRGWYDTANVMRSAVEHVPGSTHAAEFLFRRGEESPRSRGPARRLFPEAECIRIGFWIKYDPRWNCEPRSCHMHQMFVMTNADGRWDTPSASHLTCSIGLSGGMPCIALQDALNIDVSRLGQDLTTVTEDRAIAGGNQSAPLAGGWFKRSDGTFANEKEYRAPSAALSDHPGPDFVGQWHRIEVRLHLNRIVDGKGVPDGRIAYAIDDRVVLDRSDVMFRTGRHPGMRFNQLVLGPWFVDGSPQEQTFWIDDLLISADSGLPE